MNKSILAVCCISAFIVGGCGGGGGSGSGSSNPPGSVGTAEGMWTGKTSDNNTVIGFVLDDGSYWFVYTAANNSNLVAGAVHGSSTSNNGNFTSIDAQVIDFEDLHIVSATISASYFAKQRFNGLIDYPTLGENVTFTLDYDSSYDITSSLANLAGTYTGTGAVANGKETATVSVATNGTITGSSVSGCQFSGSAAPRSKGNVFDLSITFGGSPCSLGTDTVTGIAYFESTPRRLSGC